MPDTRNALRLSTPTDLASAIPLLLGYVPQDSIVAVSLHDGRVGLSLRMDLAPVQEAVEAISDFFADEEPGYTVLLAVYTYDEDYAHRLLQAATDKLSVRECLRIFDGLWFPVLCTEPICCPQGGVVIPAVSREMAAACGVRKPVAFRDALRLALLPDKAFTAQDMEKYEPDMLEDCLARWNYMLAELRDGLIPVRYSLATALVSLQDIDLRDAMITKALQDDKEAEAEELFLLLTRKAPEGFIAPPATGAGLMAWMC